MFTLSPRRFRVTHFSLALLILMSVASQCSFAQSPLAHQHPAPPAAEDQEQFISYWTTETGWRTEIDLRNNQVDQSLTVTPVLRATDGAEIPLSAVVVLPQEVKTFDVATAIGNSAPQLIGAYGSLVLRYRAPSGVNLYAVAMIMGVGHSIAFHIDGAGEDQTQDLGSREGIWWLPNTSTSDYLVLANQGPNPLETNLSVSDASGHASAQTITLAPRGMARYSIRQIVAAAKLAGSYGGIRISAVKHAGSLDTLHVLFDENGGFSAVMKMFDYDPRAQLKERDYAHTGKWTLRAPMLALANPDPSLAFPVGTVLLPQLFIRNVTSKPVEAALAFNWRTDSSTGKASGPALHLNPLETRRIDVAALQNGKTLPQNARWSSVILATNSLPGEVVAVAASYDQSLRYGAQTPFSDQLASHWAASQWQYDPQHDSVITIGNGGTKATRAAFTIFYNQGTQKYELEQALQPDEQMWIDVGKLIRESIPGKNGKTLPNTLTSGSYEIRDLTNKGIGTLFEGKVIYDKTYGHVTYGCTICCGLKRLVMFFNPLGIPFLGTSGNGVDGQDACSLEYTDISGDFDGNWSTASASIATVDTFGTHTGQGVGSTTSTTFAQEEWYVSKYSCPILQRPSNGSDNVNPSLTLQGNQYNSIFVGSDPNLATPNSIFATVKPTGGTFTETSSVTGDTFAPVQSGGPGWVVTTTTQSTNARDRKLTVTYTVSGNPTPASQFLNVTARQFAYLTNNSPSNTCTLGYGTTQLYTYTPYTHPDKTAAQAGIGLSGTAVTESFNPQPPAGTVTGSGALDPNSQFTDRISYCSSSPLTISTTITQTLSIEAYQVRQNTLKYSSTGITYTSLGPTQ
jgi:hypothetical protein